MYALCHGFIYSFLKLDDSFVDFCYVLLGCSLFAHISSLGHSTVDVPGSCEVWWQFSNGCMRRL